MMGLFTRSSTRTRHNGYDVADPEAVERQIRADLSRIGEVGDINGAILVVGGELHLRDVTVLVSGRTVTCTMEDDRINYTHKGYPVEPSDYPAVYEPRQFTPLVNIMDELENKTHSDYVEEVDLELFALNAMLILGFLGLVYVILGQIFNSYSSLAMNTVFAFVCLMTIPLFVAMSFGDSIFHWWLRKYRGLRSPREVFAEYEEDITAHVVRMCHNRGWKYRKNLKIVHAPWLYGEGIRVSFDFKDRKGNFYTLFCDGIAITGYSHHH